MIKAWDKDVCSFYGFKFESCSRWSMIKAWDKDVCSFFGFKFESCNY